MCIRDSIYPSPAHNEIFLEVNTNENKLDNVTIYNLMGVVVKNIPSLSVEGGKASINIADLSDGLYFLTAKKDDITLKGEFVKIK
jgi:hypothetical protein